MTVNLKHGATRDGKKTPEYQAWNAMRQRCLNPNNPRYADYGGRGITVDRAYDDFAAFLADVGPRPSPRHQIDREKNDLGYAPGNCKWSLPHENMTNRRNTRVVETEIGPIPLADLAQEFNIPANTLRARILKGWDLKTALITPVRAKQPNGAGRARDIIT
jgi:hypothetical protein